MSLSDFAGGKLIIYFYPKDNTPGCTRESMDFRDKIRSFSRCGTKVVGISRDSVKSHEGFKKRKQLPFPLLSDADEVACKIFDVIKIKNLYGLKVRGIERSTFLIDEKGRLRREWRKVRVKGHVEETLAAAREL